MTAAAFRMTVARSAYVVFAAVLGIPGLVTLAAALKRPSLWPMPAAVAALYGAMAFFLSRIEIRIAGGSLLYRRLLGTTTICLEDIQHADYRRVLAGRGAFIPMLIIRRAHGEPPVEINLKPFDRDDVDRLLGLPELRVVRAAARAG